MIEKIEKIYCVSDIHVDFNENMQLINNLQDHPNDLLILAGDVD